MTVLDTNYPLDEKTDILLDYHDRDVGVLEALRDRDVRGVLLPPIFAFATVAVFAYATVQPDTSAIGALLGVVVTATAATFGVKWADEALCVLRGGHTCHTCRDEAERWEVTE
jgi:hypothetical protein